ncbi:Uncharacterised protein [Chryseobacterium nakagawai]|uniref:Uncharacterized protein n=1 Tax=Chryseobacterium nakagawai TaxID=1241982 RepID=A0AAD0YNC5_CHRNA|nr:hypothetical protein [Chryseobacterium nakagawai]AZA93052.1 hypothetical protein EG343_21830 [Chryseobacterium nakagawai]VEH19685.1 Uncharacterised protein [Chryseobacterium nakagawai]
MDFDNIELDDLIEWLEIGDPKNVPPKIASYMLMLEKIWGLYKRMFEFPNIESIINHLIVVDHLQRFQAKKLVTDALTYFAAENQLSKKTWKELIADKMLKSFTAAIRVAKSSRDFKDAAIILKEMANVLDLDKEEIGEMEEDIMKQIQILTTDIKMFGEEPIDRRELASFIDSLPDVPEKVKAAAKEEVDKFPLKFLNYENNPRNGI